jgi:translation initiation factor 4E
MEKKIENFNLKNTWILWFHKVNDNNWKLESYSKIHEIKTYYDILFVIKEIDNINAGMFFLMKEGISPIFEDPHNIKGGYWSMRITKKDSYDYWEKIIYYTCIDKLTINDYYEEKINGISISPKINNCIFKIWTSDYKNMKTEYVRKDLKFINWDDTFYLEHKGD